MIGSFDAGQLRLAPTVSPETAPFGRVPASTDSDVGSRNRIVARVKLVLIRRDHPWLSHQAYLKMGLARCSVSDLAEDADCSAGLFSSER
jgi:hypothetical protein